jgi:predicted flap endonuclease-1-like 5' DNA nuclease
MAAIGSVKGVDSVLEGKLKAAGIDNSDELLAKAKTTAARRELAGKLGVDASVVLELANRADLIRIKGVAGVYSDLLENAGVDTVAELARRVPDNLQAKLEEVNTAKKVTNRVPTLEMVSGWVAEAKTLPKILEY